MAQRAFPIDPLLVRLVAPLGPRERAALIEASKAPDFAEQLQAALTQDPMDLWTAAGQPALVVLAQQQAPRGDSLDLPGYLASLSTEQLDEIRASTREERQRYEAHLDAGGSPESYDPSRAPR